jgi:hypothetical protein
MLDETDAQKEAKQRAYAIFEPFFCKLVFLLAKLMYYAGN